MPKIVQPTLTDDFDGKTLPDDTEPVHLSLGRTTYALYLSEDNHGKLLEALNPFVDGADKVDNTPAARRTAARTSTGASEADKERNAKVRHWAIDTKYEYENVKGEKTTLGDRGRIPQVVVDAWIEAGSPDIS